MKEQLFQHRQLAELGIRAESVIQAPFQGEVCTVFMAHSDIFGPVVIKTALKNGTITQEGQNEIQNNVEGYSCIPRSFRPELLAIDRENRFIVMTNAGKTLRDILWEQKNSVAKSQQSIRFFLQSLDSLLDQTCCQDMEARNCYLDELVGVGRWFLQADFFPRELADIFIASVNHTRELDNGKAAFATLDMTQGNILIDTTKNPQSFTCIDPKKPREVRGNKTFLGVSEVDIGMFITTVSLNAPETVCRLRLEDQIREIGLNDFSVNLGKLFGCILVASFPNTPQRVQTYFQSIGANWSEKESRLVEQERELHIQKAMRIAESMKNEL